MPGSVSRHTSPNDKILPSLCQSVLQWVVGGSYEKCVRARVRRDREGYD